MSAGSILSFMPDSIFFILIALALVLLYSLLPDDVKSITKKFLKQYGIFIILFLFWLYFKSKWGFVYTDPNRWPANMRYATFIAFFVLMIYGMGSWLLYKERYFSTHFICNNIAGSCVRRHDIGDWTIFYIGGSGSSDEKMVFPFPFAQKIVVVPKDSWKHVGSHMVSDCQVRKVDKTESNPLGEDDNRITALGLPEDITDFLEKDTFGKRALDEVYIGYVSEEFKTDNPGVVKLEEDLRKKDARIAELNKMLLGKMSHVKGFVSDAKAIGDKLSGKSMFNRAPREETQE